MAMSLITSRLLLKALGVNDVGIYNVIGGLVAMFGFITGAMTSSSIRYITYEVGCGNNLQLRNVFKICQRIHCILAVLIILLAEIIGLYFLFHKMSISPERENAAFWVLQFSVASSALMVIAIPYNALIIAYERMAAFALVSVLEATFRLLSVLVLLIVSYDRLILYSVLMFLVPVSVYGMYYVYVRRCIPSVRGEAIFSGSLMKEMAAYSAWNMWGGCASVLSNHGVNLMLNVFFCPAVNAARYFAVQVQHAVMMFGTNFQTAVNPQIVKSYAAGNREYTNSLLNKSCKITFYLVAVLMLPVVMECDFIMRLWLDSPPQYTVAFVNLSLLSLLISLVSRPLIMAIGATGEIKWYQTTVGAILMLVLPCSYVVLRAGCDPVAVFIVSVFVEFLATIARLLFSRKLLDFPISRFVSDVVLRGCLALVLGAALPLYVMLELEEGWCRFCLISGLAVFGYSIAFYAVGLNAQERRFIHSQVSKYKVLFKS